MSPNRLLLIFSHPTRGIWRLNDTIEKPDRNRQTRSERFGSGVIPLIGARQPTRSVSNVARIQRRDRIVICISHSSPDSNTIHTRFTSISRWRHPDNFTRASILFLARNNYSRVANAAANFPLFWRMSGIYVYIGAHRCAVNNVMRRYYGNARCRYRFRAGWKRNDKRRKKDWWGGEKKEATDDRAPPFHRCRRRRRRRYIPRSFVLNVLENSPGCGGYLISDLLSRAIASRSRVVLVFGGRVENEREGTNAFCGPPRLLTLGRTIK